MDDQTRKVLLVVRHELTVLDNLTVTDMPGQIGKKDNIYWITDHANLLAEIDSVLNK